MNKEVKKIAKKYGYIDFKVDNLYCPKCGRSVFREIYKTEDDYPYVCLNCDENFFRVELIEGEN